jgi:hypothetical protein
MTEVLEDLERRDSWAAPFYHLTRDLDVVPDFAGKLRIVRIRRVGDASGRLHFKVAIEFVGWGFVIHSVDFVLSDEGVPRANLPRRTATTEAGISHFYIGTWNNARTRQAFSEAVHEALIWASPELANFTSVTLEPTQ